ncbi:MAG: bifunctional diaminohydroxyphosphoribosylaminopyrimidine deaminase/5-amino-6-(5-phosphoribosylamino)uracil reductase RibD [Shewanellaceae bacterium]|nr:bifunctional diaminohydroxyphosphoribosylaminopyrimidine deaminase/5-amino-6-(5-phosphoribosylamino)uracil reductase RibD [Shewanellaceae bacterium]
MVVDSVQAADEHWMQLALRLAEQGVYTTQPNPRVGCVLVRQGQLVGQGFHARAGAAHAEVNALHMAGSQAVGATCYVTLEPCCHTGRTPPCLDKLLQAGVTRVVIGALDSNPCVAGQSVSRLEAAGIAVTVGILATESRALNQGFFKRMEQGTPWIRLKLACSLDGKIALANGDSKWITGELAREDVQRWRAQSCAVLTTAQTIRLDNPKMNVRFAEVIDQGSRQRQPVTVILDTQAMLTPDWAVFQQGQQVVLLAGKPYTHVFAEHVSCYQIPVINQHLCLEAAMELLGELEFNEVLVEAGGILAGELWQSNLWDELILYQAPKLMGADARHLMNLPLLTQMDEIPTLNCVDQRRIGCDTRFRFLR